MNWNKISVERLREYKVRQEAVESIPAQITTLEMQYTAIRSAATDGMPVKGGTADREESLLSNIAMRDELTANLEIAKREVENTRKGLSALTDQERRVLELFFIDRPTNYISTLCEELGYEKTKIYQTKDAALRKFTKAVYGVVDI